MTTGNRKEESVQALARLMQEGSREAFGMLYDKYAPALLVLINGLSNDVQLSEEVLQKTFIRMWMQKDDFDASVTSIFSWMVHIARNTTREALKDKVVPDIKIHENIYAISGRQSDEGAEAQAHLSALRMKDALHLVFIKGRSYNEAARELNLPVELLKTSIRSAIKQTAAEIL